MTEPLHIFVDEAGDPTLFGSKRGSGVIVGNEGCSQYFIIGKLEVYDPISFSKAFHEFHGSILRDPYFAGVESFKPERKKMAVGFHANSDLPEVRYQVFNFLKAQGEKLRFHAVVADKRIVAEQEIKRRDNDPAARFKPNTFYDGLIRSLFSKLHTMSDIGYHVCIARRGNSDRTEALRKAMEHAENDFESTYGFRRGFWIIEISSPEQTNCLQAVDYFLWAVQRFYELKEDRFMNMLWPQIGEIHDLHLGSRSSGTFFKGTDIPTLKTVFPRNWEQKKKRPRI
ncbi:MAG: hypothetical protein EOL87_07305 [Spartobacteria bacterium]|nr:hypothetical protein [Spartobacteria bacterium]